MTNLTLLTDQTETVPATPYHARHFINGTACDSADGRMSDRISPSHGVLVSRAALGSEVETNAAIKAAGKASDSKGKDLFMPIRVKITGSGHGPELVGILDVLGRDEVIARLRS